MTLAHYSTITACLPRLQATYSKLQDLAHARGLSFTVADYGGIRDAAITAQLQAWEREAVAQGEEPYRVAPYGQSKHDYGGAFDAEMETGILEQLGALADDAGLVWGGTWHPEPDAPHFELPESLAELEQEWQAYIATQVFPPPPQGDAP